jgi:hypothetical protein
LILLARNRKFESIPLQQRVYCELSARRAVTGPGDAVS